MLAASLGLHKSLFQNLEAESVALDVHLGGGKSVGCTGGLEVHVAQVVLIAQNVAQYSILVFSGVLDKTHSDTAYRALHGYAGIHQAEAARANGGH